MESLFYLVCGAFIGMSHLHCSFYMRIAILDGRKLKTSKLRCSKKRKSHRDLIWLDVFNFPVLIIAKDSGPPALLQSQTFITDCVKLFPSKSGIDLCLTHSAPICYLKRIFIILFSWNLWYVVVLCLSPNISFTWLLFDCKWSAVYIEVLFQSLSRKGDDILPLTLMVILIIAWNASIGKQVMLNVKFKWSLINDKFFLEIAGSLECLFTTS